MILHRPRWDHHQRTAAQGEPVWVNPRLVRYAEPSSAPANLGIPISKIGEASEPEPPSIHGTILYFERGAETEDNVFVMEPFDQVVAQLDGAIAGKG